MYNQETYRILGEIGVSEECREMIQESSFEPIEKKDLTQALEALSVRNPKTIACDERRFIKAIEIPFDTHLAYLVVEYEDGIPKTLHYCDGNIILSKTDINGRGLGVIGYEVDPNFIKTCTEDDFLPKILHIFSTSPKIYKSGKPNNVENLKEILRKIVVCGPDGNPRITSEEIFTKKQNRGNCAAKSMNLALRLILSKINPALTYDKTGEKTGRGYEFYKKYKKFIIEKSLDNLIEATNSDAFKSKEQPFYHLILRTFESCFLQAASKNNVALMARLKEIFDAEKIAFDKIKATREHEANAITIAAFFGKVEAFEWCLKNIPLDKSLAEHLDDKLLTFIKKNKELLELTFATLAPSNFAIKFDKANVLEMLLENKEFNFAAENYSEVSILKWVVERRKSHNCNSSDNYLRIAELCLDRDPEIYRNGQAGIALICAANNGDFKAAELLVRKIAQNQQDGASLDDYFSSFPQALFAGENPMDIAQEKGDKAMAALFRSYKLSPSCDDKILPKRKSLSSSEAEPSPSFNPENPEIKFIKLSAENGVAENGVILP